MKKQLEKIKNNKKKFIILTIAVILIAVIFIAKVSFTADVPVKAQTWILEKDWLQEVNVSKYLTNASDSGGIQGNVVTHKHIVFASLSTSGNSYIYFMDKTTGAIDTSLTIKVPLASDGSNSEYGHMNDMTYNPNTGEIFIPYTGIDDKKAKVAIIKYTDKTQGTVNKNNIKIVNIPVPESIKNNPNNEKNKVSGIAYYKENEYIFRMGKTIWIAQREGDGFSDNITTFTIGASETEKKFFYMTGQGIFSYEDYIYITLYECGDNYPNLQPYYYDSTEKGSNIILAYKINENKNGATFLKALYIPGIITNHALDNNDRTSEIETGSFDPETGELYLGYNITKVSGETKKTKIFYKLQTGEQVVNGKKLYFEPSGLPKTQSTITGENMVTTTDLVRYYNANSNSRNDTENKNITWKDLSGTKDATILNRLKTTETFKESRARLDGTDDWVNMGVIDEIYNKVTLETQFILDSIPESATYLISNAEAGGYILYVRGTGKPGFQAYIDGGYKQVEINESIVTGKVYNLSGVFDGRYLRLYLDGVLKATTDLGSTGNTVTIPGNSTVMAIAANPSGSSATGGYAYSRIFSARVYKTALTENQVKQNMLADRVTTQNLSVNSKDLTLTINFSQAVNSLTEDDIDVQNGTCSSVTKISDYKYRVEITNAIPSSTLTVSTKSEITDIAGNEVSIGTAKMQIDVEKAATPTVTAYNHAYDGNAHGVTVTGVSGGTVRYSTDNSTWTETAPTYKDFTNGAKTVYVKVAGDSTHSDSDVVTSSVNITKKSITVTANNKTINYGDTIPTLDWSVGETGVSGETGKASGALATTATETSSVGTYDITKGTVALANNGTFKTSNYSMSFIKGTLTITSVGADFTTEEKYKIVTVNSNQIKSIISSTSGLCSNSTSEYPQYWPQGFCITDDYYVIYNLHRSDNKFGFLYLIPLTASGEDELDDARVIIGRIPGSRISNKYAYERFDL